MAECMRQEAEASLTCDVILVDRPVLDALGYLQAALEVTCRQFNFRGDSKRSKPSLMHILQITIYLS